MKMIIYQITRPLSYLSIDHKEKWKFDWLIPLIVTLLTSIILVVFRNKLNIYGVNGLISQITSFVQILPGFYIAALAAISTFNKNDIDQLMPEPTPKVEILIRGEKNIIGLTRRRFLCMLFAFLVAESIAISITGIFLLNFAEAIKMIISTQFQPIVSVFCSFCFFLLFWQLIISTLLGLYYLGDKMHQPNLE